MEASAQVSPSIDSFQASGAVVVGREWIDHGDMLHGLPTSPTSESLAVAQNSIETERVMTVLYERHRLGVVRTASYTILHLHAYSAYITVIQMKSVAQRSGKAKTTLHPYNYVQCTLVTRTRSHCTP